jgi:hypothetical protein
MFKKHVLCREVYRGLVNTTSSKKNQEEFRNQARNQPWISEDNSLLLGNVCKFLQQFNAKSSLWVTKLRCVYDVLELQHSSSSSQAPIIQLLDKKSSTSFKCEWSVGILLAQFAANPARSREVRELSFGTLQMDGQGRISVSKLLADDTDDA